MYRPFNICINIRTVLDRGISNSWTYLFSFFLFNAKYVLHICFSCSRLWLMSANMLAFRVINTYLRSRARELPYLSIVKHAFSLSVRWCRGIPNTKQQHSLRHWKTPAALSSSAKPRATDAREQLSLANSSSAALESKPVFMTPFMSRSVWRNPRLVMTWRHRGG